MAQRLRPQWTRLFAAATLALVAQSALAAPNAPEALEPVAPPKAFVEFCFRQPSECPAALTAVPNGSATGAKQAAASTYWRLVFNTSPPSDLSRNKEAIADRQLVPNEDSSLRLLTELNRKINRKIAERSDIETYGANDYWTLPLNAGGSGQGDCEDFALEKRRALRQAGYREDKLALALVKTPWGQNHAVLLVATPMGEFVLDNLSPHVEPWQRSSYVLIARQSFEDPAVWLGSRRVVQQGAGLEGETRPVG